MQQNRARALGLVKLGWVQEVINMFLWWITQRGKRKFATPTIQILWAMGWVVLTRRFWLNPAICRLKRPIRVQHLLIFGTVIYPRKYMSVQDFLRASEKAITIVFWRCGRIRNWRLDWVSTTINWIWIF